MTPTKSLLKISRLFHLYLGVFATPAIIFFAVTGFLQTFSFHETTRGSDYKPPKLFVELAQLHKKQTLVVPQKKAPAPTAPGPSSMAKPEEASTRAASGKATRDSAAGGDRPKASSGVTGPVLQQASEEKKKNLWPMKIFFAIISSSLLLSTFTGLYMAYKYVRNKTLITAALLGGVLIPILLLVF